MTGFARDGTQLFAQEFPERYFLARVVKSLKFDIPRALGNARGFGYRR